MLDYYIPCDTYLAENQYFTRLNIPFTQFNESVMCVAKF